MSCRCVGCLFERAFGWEARSRHVRSRVKSEMLGRERSPAFRIKSLTDQMSANCQTLKQVAAQIESLPRVALVAEIETVLRRELELNQVVERNAASRRLVKTMSSLNELTGGALVGSAGSFDGLANEEEDSAAKEELAELRRKRCELCDRLCSEFGQCDTKACQACDNQQELKEVNEWQSV